MQRFSRQTHYDDGVPTTARKVWDVVEGTKYWPRHGGANLGAESFISRHPESPISCVSPGKDLIVCKKKKLMSYCSEEEKKQTNKYLS